MSSRMPDNTESTGNRGDISADSLPNALWPSDNDYGIPLLDLEQQATVVDAPFVKWGREQRKSRMRGTWHFYTDDYRFTALWGKPHHLIASACVAAVECNFSVPPGTPRALALYATYRKRYLARLWQEHGVRILVDLNVAPEHARDNLLGVPRGWRAYATRGSTQRLAELEHDADLAEEHAGRKPLLVVYGGGYEVRRLAQTRGWAWVAEDSDTSRGRTVEWDGAAPKPPRSDATEG
jgi:hypothetical protein